MQDGLIFLFIGTVFVAGILSFFSPCVFPLLPVYMGKLLDYEESKVVSFAGLSINLVSMGQTLAFILGLSAVFIGLGFGAGFMGQFIYHPYTSYVMGLVAILLGLQQMELINIQWMQQEKKMQVHSVEKNQWLGAFLLGITFSFGWTPCIGPVLGSVLAIALSGSHDAWYGALLMLVYTLGMAIPFLILSLASSWLVKKISPLKKHMILLKKIGGFLIVLMGLLLMAGHMNWFSTIRF